MGNVIGVVVVLSKQFGQWFEETDEKVLTAVNVFVGTVLENAKIYQQSIKFTEKLNFFL
jgi:hypothetical protein